MIMEFLAVIVAGFGGFGVAHFLHRISWRSLPDWIAPFGAAGGMLLMVIWLEYTWAGRFEAGLPDDVTVVSKNEVRIWYRPWTYIVPLSTRITAIDNRVRQTNRVNPDLVLTGIVLKERWALTFGFQSLFDCANARRSDLTEGTRLDDAGIPLDAEWYQLTPDDPFLTVACGGGAAYGGPREEGADSGGRG
ncbi:hypothetical protein [Roseinatronobacter alkalisoli]|uniref:Uncharacterized protein n=1 Tax=Roseinatronobacter alkalisoli TaxID=3028235 RepID=A0ABT5T3P2_9RHOB|nr:hypothetical protein [Roseinatronobacter sp. HJB301]MDD7969731.1 hypothetical protein [Roseinatronobacter sp. HJB301]